MKRGHRDEWEPYLDQLRRLPFVQEAAIETARNAAIPTDAVLNLRTRTGVHQIAVEQTSLQQLHPAVLEAKLARHKSPDRPWILFAPFISRQKGEFLREHGVQYIDRVGNSHLRIDDDHVALIDGRKPDPPPNPRPGGGAKRALVLFALLAKEDLVRRPVREVAQSAGVGRSVTADALAHLRENGIVGFTGRRLVILQVHELLERWLALYATTVRPKYLTGRFHSRVRGAEDLESQIESEMSGERMGTWGFGGTAGTFRLFRHYRGEETVVHSIQQPPFAKRSPGFSPSSTGNLVSIQIPSPAAYESETPGIVHPLLLYSELLAQGGSRERETAMELRQRHLARLA